jgi:LPS-assembly protein
MIFPFRRKPIALLFCYGFASALVGGFAGEARAQASAPLHVDPVLLGLPPITPAEAPVPAATPSTAAETVEKTRPGIKPVEETAVEVLPVEIKPEVGKPDRDSKSASPRNVPARTVVPQAMPAAAAPSSVPVPADVALPAGTPPVRRPREDERPVAPALPVRQSAKQPDSASQVLTPVAAAQTQATKPAVPQQVQASQSTSSLTPLRVDPALLGAPSVATSLPPSQASGGAGAGRPTSVATGSLARAAGGSVPSGAARKTNAAKSWYQRFWDPVENAYDNGTWELFLPFHTHHLRSKYSAETIASYQENPLGFGVGRGLYDEKGNWDGVYAMTFQDSHNKPMYIAGYGWKAVWRPAEDVRLGLGYTLGLASRSNYFDYVPFPVVFPLASLAYKNFSLEGTFIPGGTGNGNVFFFWAKWELGKAGEAIGTPTRPAPPAPTEIANTSFGSATPVVHQQVPYGPALETGSRLASSSEIVPPLVPATGPRDEEEVPDDLPPLALRTSNKMVPPPKDSTVPRPVFLSAHRMGGEVEREFVAEGDAELRRIGTVVNSDRLTYWPIDDELEAEGNVRLEQGEDLITGPRMRLKLEDQVGFFEQPTYTIKRQPLIGSKAADDKEFAARFLEQPGNSSWLTSGFASPLALGFKPGQTSYGGSTKMKQTMTEGRGEADRIDFEGENQVRLTNGTYTTCAPGNNDWYAKANELKLDYDREVGDAQDGTIYFKGMPILYSPWLSFSLNNQRKSGFLAPSFGTKSDSGVELSLPYYWNIAPNLDATITPHVMTKRGMQVNSDIRYLNTAYGGSYNSQARVELLPGDRLRDNEKRYGFSLIHTQTTANGFSGTINYNKVSDDNYYTDLSSGIASTSTTQLLQQGTLAYGGGGWWNAVANFQQYQTLQPDAKNPVREPYKMLPQFTVNARKPDFYMTDSSFMGQYTNFTRSDQVINGVEVSGDGGRRTVLYPQVALPYVRPGWYVTPKLGVNVRHYALSGQAAGTPGSIGTTLPIFSLDSGMTFERTSNWFGKDYTQTLEPRLYYLNIPYKNQDKIPLFDTGLADFNFAQIFSENQFSSWDRINNANQLTAAATTRLLEPATGNEIMRAMLGQRFYFTKNKVALTASSSTADDEGKWDKSDLLAAFSGQILPKVYVDTAVQYTPSDREFQRYSVGSRYQPEPGKVLNAAYRYNRAVGATVDQVDLSGQWPLSGKWHAVGRINYSFKDDATNITSSTQGGRMIESIAGLEYNGGCWVVRGVIQRTALTQDKTSSAFFIQLELSDFSRIGSNPLNLLKRNIQGYSLINQPAADPAFGE